LEHEYTHSLYDKLNGLGCLLNNYLTHEEFEVGVKGVWLRNNREVKHFSSVGAVPFIDSNDAHDAIRLAQIQFPNQNILFRIHAEEWIDVEGSLDLLRLCQHYDLSAHVELPLDPSALIQASRIGCLSIGVRLSHPQFESGISRPDLLREVVPLLSVPCWGSGRLSIEKVPELSKLGFTGIILDSKWDPSEYERAESYLLSVVNDRTIQ
jgi:hypothetical protein